MIESRAPKCVLVAPYYIFKWLYRPLIPVLRERHGTRFVFMVPEVGDTLKSYDDILGPEDIVVRVPSFAAMAKSGDSAVEPFAQARANEARYGALLYRDILQQERPLAEVTFANSRMSVESTEPLPSMENLTRAANGYYAFFEKLFAEHPIDLALLWPRSGAEAVCVSVARAHNVLTTYPYTAKWQKLAYWATGAYSTAHQHKVVYETVEECDPFPEEAIVPPGRPKYLDHDRISKRYSLTDTLRQMAVIVFHRLEFAWIDLRDGKKGARKKLWPILRKPLSNWAYYRRFDPLCERDVGRLVSQPFVFFAFQNEPEFSVQGRCKEFNDQRAILRQLAVSLPPGVRLVLKEHAWVGERQLDLFRELLCLPNVVMAHPAIPAVDLIRHAKVVASLNGTVTLEAAMFGKGALLFSHRSEFCMMPHVRVVTDLHELPRLLREVMDGTPEQELVYRKAATRFCRTLDQITFDGAPLYSGQGGEVAADQIARAADLLLSLLERYRAAPTEFD